MLAAAETPLQLLNLLSVLYDCRDNLPMVNLAVYKAFDCSNEIISAIKSTGLLNDVFLISPYYQDFQQYRAAVVSLEHALSPKRHWDKFGSALSMIPNISYSILMGGVATVYLMDLKQKFVPRGYTILYEEGEGSYLGNSVKSAAMNDRELLVRSKTIARGILGSSLSLLSRGRLSLNAKELRVYRPDLIEQGVYRRCLSVRKITPITGEKKRLLARVFNNECTSSIRPRCWIYLGNPDVDLPEEDVAATKRHLAVIGNACSELIYRPHPRTQNKSLEGLPQSVRIDEGTKSWEVACANGQITDDTVLFGYGSTALSNPKKMFDLEPFVVSLHRMLSENINKIYSEKAFMSLKSIYTVPEKVCAPETIEELEGVLEMLPSQQLGGNNNVSSN